MSKIANHPRAKMIYAVSALVCFGLAWAVALMAIDTGRLWLYVLFFGLVVVGIKEVVQLVRVSNR